MEGQIISQKEKQLFIDTIKNNWIELNNIANIEDFNLNDCIFYKFVFEFNNEINFITFFLIKENENNYRITFYPSKTSEGTDGYFLKRDIPKEIVEQKVHNFNELNFESYKEFLNDNKIF